MQDKIAFCYIEQGEYRPRGGLPFIKRENIAAIIRYQKQYLFLSWKEVNYKYSLVTGGINAKESKKEAVKREVVEETGYYDFKMLLK